MAKHFALTSPGHPRKEPYLESLESKDRKTTQAEKALPTSVKKRENLASLCMHSTGVSHFAPRSQQGAPTTKRSQPKRILFAQLTHQRPDCANHSRVQHFSKPGK
eukprot:1159746-Pelagomonas_calceolata.AAC.2